MDAVFIKLLNMSIAASWLIVAVVILRLLLKKAPKWMNCILWGMVAVRLVCPFSFESTLSLIPNAENIHPDIVRYLPKTTGNSGIPVINHTISSADPMIRENFAPMAGASTHSLYAWMYVGLHIVEIVWIIGLSGLLGYALLRYFRLHKSVSEAMFLRDNIWMGDMVTSPFILGIIRSKIYVPSSTEESQMDYMLAHEQAHIKRKDHWWKLLGYLLLAVYWFNPLSWVAYILLCRDIELACDEKVICGLNEDEKELYLNTLVSCSMQCRVVMAYPLAFGEVGVGQRVKAALHYKKPAFLVVLLSIAACLVVAVCFLTTSPRSPKMPKTLKTHQKDVTVTIPEKDNTSTLDAKEKMAKDKMAKDEMNMQEKGLPIAASPMELLFASGASSAGTMLMLHQDGSFEGKHFDHENAASKEHPNGIEYICNFNGKFENIKQINEYAYSMVLGELATEKEEGEEWVEDGILYIASKPWGLEGGKEFLLYAPETPLDELSEDFLLWWMGWWSYAQDEENPQALPCYGLLNVETEQGFFNYE